MQAMAAYFGPTTLVDPQVTENIPFIQKIDETEKDFKYSTGVCKSLVIFCKNLCSCECCAKCKSSLCCKDQDIVPDLGLKVATYFLLMKILALWMLIIILIGTVSFAASFYTTRDIINPALPVCSSQYSDYYMCPTWSTEFDFWYMKDSPLFNFIPCGKKYRLVFDNPIMWGYSYLCILPTACIVVCVIIKYTNNLQSENSSLIKNEGDDEHKGTVCNNKKKKMNKLGCRILAIVLTLSVSIFFVVISSLIMITSPQVKYKVTFLLHKQHLEQLEILTAMYGLVQGILYFITKLTFRNLLDRISLNTDSSFNAWHYWCSFVILSISAYVPILIRYFIKGILIATPWDDLDHLIDIYKLEDCPRYGCFVDHGIFLLCAILGSSWLPQLVIIFIKICMNFFTYCISNFKKCKMFNCFTTDDSRFKIYFNFCSTRLKRCFYCCSFTENSRFKRCLNCPTTENSRFKKCLSCSTTGCCCFTSDKYKMKVKFNCELNDKFLDITIFYGYAVLFCISTGGCLFLPALLIIITNSWNAVYKYLNKTQDDNFKTWKNEALNNFHWKCSLSIITIVALFMNVAIIIPNSRSIQHIGYANYMGDWKNLTPNYLEAVLPKRNITDLVRGKDFPVLTKLPIKDINGSISKNKCGKDILYLPFVNFTCLSNEIKGKKITQFTQDDLQEFMKNLSQKTLLGYYEDGKLTSPGICFNMTSQCRTRGFAKGSEEAQTYRTVQCLFILLLVIPIFYTIVFLCVLHHYPGLCP